MKVKDRIKQTYLYRFIRNRLFYYKGPDPMKVIIVGLPRSGTSFLAGLVSKMGFDPGPADSLRTKNKFNPHGYYENIKLMGIDHNLLMKFGGTVMNPPSLPGNWIKHCDDEKDKVQRIVKEEGIEVYKGNMLIVLADLYYEVFPNAKWIFISRDENEIVKSILNADETQTLNEEYLEELVEKWKMLWTSSRASKNCLNIKYEDFFTSSENSLQIISNYLEQPLSSELTEVCLDFFKPNIK